jgi:YaiO family outer membrane protein
MLGVVALQAAVDPAYAAAVQARTSGRIPEAVSAFEALSRQRPTDADVWLNLGLAYGAAHRYADADRALERGLSLAPDYTDLRLAYARNAWFAGDASAAEARLAPLSAGPSAAEARRLQQQIEASRTQAAASDEPSRAVWRVDLAHSYSWLSEGLGDWRSRFAAITRQRGATAFGVSVEETERFGNQDVYVEASAYGAFANGADGFLAIGGAPDADYRPEIAVRAGGSVPVLHSAGAWRLRLGADAAWSRYPVGDVRSVQPYLSVSRGPVDLMLRSINTLDERDEFRAGYALRAGVSATDQLRLVAGWADAPESSDGVTVDVQATSLGAALDLDARTTVRLDAVKEVRKAYDRNELTLSLTRKF